MNVTVRKGTAKDVASVTALWRSLVGTAYRKWDEEYPGEEEASRDAAAGDLYVLCLENGEIIGAMSAGDEEELWKAALWSREIKRHCCCSRLGISVKYQNLGLAERLFSAVEQDVRKRGYDGIGFLVSPDHEAALALYHKMNYIQVGEASFYELDWLCYEKKLKI